MDKTYALIDKNSGYFWGWSKASAPEEAIRKVDSENKESNDYFRTDPHSYDVTYFVYDISQMINCNDVYHANGQDQVIIDRICSYPLVGAYARKQ